MNLDVQSLDFTTSDRLIQTRLPADTHSKYAPDELAQGTNDQVRLAQGVVLVAKKSMTDPNFARTVLLITEYEDTGTVGLILNRPLDKPVTDVLPQLRELNLDSLNLYLGGPVRLNSLRLLVRTDLDLDDHYHVLDNVFQITDFQGIQHLLSQESKQFEARLYVGYAGWFPGQLERELLRGDWYLSRVDSAMIFMDEPEILWEKLIDRLEMQWVSRIKKKTLNVSFFPANGEPRMARLGFIEAVKAAPWMAAQCCMALINSMPDQKKKKTPACFFDVCPPPFDILKKNINMITYY